MGSAVSGPVVVNAYVGNEEIDVKRGYKIIFG